MDQNALSPAFNGTIAALGLVLGTVSLLHTISKDNGIGLGARRARAVENAKNRLAFWHQKLSIQSAALGGIDLEKAKMAAVEAAENIHRDLNQNLETLRVWTGPPPVIVGLRWWQNLFLLYRPIDGVKWFGYFTRVAYLLTCVGLLVYLIAVIRLYWLFQTEAPDKQVIDHAYLTSKKGLGAMLSLGFCCLSLLWSASMFYRTVRHERSPRRFKELDRI